MKFILILSLFFTLTTSSFAAATPSIGWSKGHFSNDAGARDYFLYLPKNYSASAKVPLMVMLHGCFQDPTSFSKETGMNDVADKYGFAVLYPEQTFQNNIWKCWNWFKPENQQHDSAELSIIVGMVGQLKSAIKIDQQKVYVAGLSAGAAMAANLVACHNDVFAGAGIHSGMEYAAATSESEAHQVTGSGSTHDLHQSGIEAAKCSGPKSKMAAIIAIHGKDDNFVNPINTDNVVQQFSKMNDILDNAKDDNSQNTRIITTREDQVPNGYRYTTDFFGGNGKIMIQKVTVFGMKHAWSGAHQAGQYADPKGPDASEMIWLFLSNYSVSGKK